MKRTQAIETGTDTPLWFLRIDSDHVRGPMPLARLVDLAQCGGIAPADEVSPDGRSWRPVHTLSELEMDWLAELEDGRVYGPFNILASANLVNRGVLQTDSVMRRKQASAPEAAPEPVARGADATDEDDAALAARIRQLEQEFCALRNDLSRARGAQAGGTLQQASLNQADRPLSPEIPLTIDTLIQKMARTEALLQQLSQRQGRPAPDDAPEETGDRLLPATREQPWERPKPLPAGRQRYYTYDEAIGLARQRDLKELAHIRRFRAQTLRWNIMASSLLIGTGVTVGSLGYILEVVPLHVSGLVIAGVGVLYFLTAGFILCVRKLLSWATLSLTATEADLADDEKPVRSVLNITFTWFNRTFGSDA